MAVVDNKEANKTNNMPSNGDKEGANDGEGMPPEERREEVLDFLAEHGIALPPKAIFRGLKLERGINFSYSTVKNALADLERAGHVSRVDKEALDDGEIETISGDTSSRRAYYLVTEAGRDHLKN